MSTSEHMGELVLRTNWRNKSTRKRLALKAIRDHEPDVLQSLIEDRLAADEDSLSIWTVRKYRRALDLYMEFLKPDEGSATVMIHQADDDTIRDWLTWLRDEKDLEVSSRGVYLAGVRYLYKCLVWARALDYNPAQLVKTPRDARERSTLRTQVSDDDLETLLEYLYKVIQAPIRRRRKADAPQARVIANQKDRDEQLLCYRDLVMVRLAYDAGLRVSSICKLELDSLIFEHADGPHLLIRQAKGRRQYQVPMTEALRQALQWWLPLREPLAQKGPLGQDFVVVNIVTKDYRYRGAGVGTSTARRNIANLYKRAGIGERYQGLHSFRHACGAALAATGDLELTKLWLGHKDMNTTSATYANRSLKSLEDGKAALKR